MLGHHVLLVSSSVLMAIAFQSLGIAILMMTVATTVTNHTVLVVSIAYYSVKNLTWPSSRSLGGGHIAGRQLSVCLSLCQSATSTVLHAMFQVDNKCKFLL